MLTVADILQRTSGYLAGKGVGTPRLDAELLIAHALGVERITLYTHAERPLTLAETDACRALVARRARREPVAQILGRRGFRRLELEVTADVLVPRPETEHLVEWAVAVAPPGGSLLDWGTGSGAVAIAVHDERPDLAVTALDRSPAALAVAARNAAARPIALLLSDGFAAVAGRRFDVIAANPPYLSDAELATAEAELAYEPRDALASGPTGLEAIERIAAEAPAHLRPGGHLLVEIGAAQGEAAAGALSRAGLRDVAVRRDLAGLDRVAGGRSAAERPA